MLKMSQIRAMFIADRDHSAEWRRQCYEDFDFYAGHGQWTTEERMWLRSQKRVDVVFNRTATIINTVAGNEVQNREEIRYSPVEEGDIRPNEVLDSAAKWFRKEAEAEDVESEAFTDTLICGMGWTETVLDFETDVKGKPAMSPPHPREMFWDCSSRRKGLRDSRRRWRVREIPLKDAIDLMGWEETDPRVNQLDARWTGLDFSGSTVDQDQADKYQDDGSNAASTEDYYDNKVVLVQLQIKEKVVQYSFVDPGTGETTFMEKEKFNKLNERLKMLGEPPMNGHLTKRWVHRQYWVGTDILEDPTDLPVDTFTLKCITGYRDRNKGTFFGMISMLRDPQKWANKFLSQILHIINKSAKGGVMAERGAVEDEGKFKASWSKMDEVTFVNDGMMDRIKEKPDMKVPSGLFSMMQFAIDSIRESSGVNIEMLGQRGAVQAMGLEAQRKEAGLTILAPVFDSLKVYRVDHGKMMLGFIKLYLNDGRLIRLTGQGNTKFVPLALQQDLSFDITVDEAPTSPHIKEKVWAFVMPMIDKLPPPVLIELLPFSPLPGSVVEKLQNAIKQTMQPDPASEKLKQIGVAQAGADVQMTQAAASAKMAEAQKVEFDIKDQKFGNIIELIKMTGEQNGQDPAAQPAVG